ncbi:hypothetical protein IC575_025480 [Cucumis melo]|uniref:Organ-specific protein P4-like n=1 Tax=Cucumis melo TaxID=3656 RepID=A0A9I9DN86_CUCME
MKLSIAFFFLLSLLLLGDIAISHGRSRKEEGEYWKKIMKEEALPEMLKELLLEDDDSSIVEYNNKQQKEHFTTNFDPHPNAIIYHAHAHAHAHNSNPTLPNLSP